MVAWSDVADEGELRALDLTSCSVTSCVRLGKSIKISMFQLDIYRKKMLIFIIWHSKMIITGAIPVLRTEIKEETQ